MRGLIVDYVGVLDGSSEDRRRWRALFAELKAHGIRLGVLSNDPGGPGAAEIRHLAERGIVHSVVLSGEIGVEKPEPEAYLMAAEILGVPANDCVFVDDNILNVRGAVDTGLVGVYYQHFDRAVVEITTMFGLESEF